MTLTSALVILHLLLFSWTVLLSSPEARLTIPNRPVRSYVELGDINLGAFLAVSEYSPVALCGERIRFPLLQQYVEALVYAIREVNSNSSLLPTASLGFAILDDCVKESTAVAQAVRFLPRISEEPFCPSALDYENATSSTSLTSSSTWLSLSPTSSQTSSSSSSNNNSSGDNSNNEDFFNVVGVIGPLRSENSIAVSYLLGPAKIPQISFLSTSDELSNKEVHPYFLRVIPPDQHQVRAIMSFIAHQGWSYLHVIYSSGSYGEFAYDNIRGLSQRFNMCIATQYKTNLGMSVEDYREAVRGLLKFPRARVVVMFVGGGNMVGIFKAVYDLNAVQKFIWIGSEAWSERLSLLPGQYKEALYGAFTTSLFVSDVPKYQEHFRRIKPSNTNNPWFSEFWERQLGCSFSHGTCNESVDVSESERFSFLSLNGAAIDTVYVYAHALHNLLTRECPGLGGREVRACIKGEQLLDYIKDVSFQGYTGHIQFDESGNNRGKYVLSQVLPGNPYTQVPVGVIDTTGSQNVTVLNSISWEFLHPLDDDFGPDAVLPVSRRGVEGSDEDTPVSVCSRLCAVDEYILRREQPCCWECRKCRDNEIVTSDRTSCEVCPQFMWPDSRTNFTTCQLIPPDFATGSDPIVIIEICSSCAGILSSCAIFAMYFRFRNAPVIRAASRELSFLQLISILLGYVTMLIYVIQPTKARCYAVYFLFCLTFNCIYASLLVKAIRIYRIFHSATKGARSLRGISPISQVIISTVIVLGQVVICLSVTITCEPGAKLTQPVRTEKYVERSCDMTLAGLTSFLAYNLTLVLLCSIFAFKTRKLPDNFNESRFMSMCVSTTLVIWLAFIPTYLTSSRQYLKTLLLALALLLNHSVTLVFLFVTKVYAVLYIEPQEGGAGTATNGRLYPTATDNSATTSTSNPQRSSLSYTKTSSEMLEAPPPRFSGHFVHNQISPEFTSA